MKRMVCVAMAMAGLVVMGSAEAGAAEDFMMKAARNTMEGDVKGYAKHMFPKEDLISVETAPTDKKFKEIHPRQMTVMMSNDVKIELLVTGRVNRENTGGLPYTIEVLSISNLKCMKKDKPVLPDGAQKALGELKELVTEAAKKAAQEAYPNEKVELVTVTELVGDQDQRTGTATVSLTNGVKVELTVSAGYAYDPKANGIKAAVAGFTKAVCTKNGQPDTPAKAIKLLGEAEASGGAARGGGGWSLGKRA